MKRALATCLSALAACSPDVDRAPSPASDKAEAPGGDGAAPGQSGDATWTPLPEGIAGCPVDRLTMTSPLRAFTFRPCDGTPMCEEAQFDAWLSGRADALEGGAIVQGSAGARLTALAIHRAGEAVVLFVHPDGLVEDAYRARQEGGCLLTEASVSGDRCGAVLTASAGPRLGGLLHTRGDAAPPTTFEITPPPPGFGPSPLVMTRDRWLFRYAPSRYVTVSTADGSGPVTFAAADGASILDLGRAPSSTGARFLFGMVTEAEGGATGSLAVSDGVAAPTTWLAPPPGTFYADPVFTGSHVAWLAGTGPQAKGTFDAVTIWASPYGDDAAAPAPFLVDDYPDSGLTSRAAGGQGWFAAISFEHEAASGEVVAWRLTGEGARRAIALPGGRRASALLGVAPQGLWVTGSNGAPAPADTLFRLRLD